MAGIDGETAGLGRGPATVILCCLGVLFAAIWWLAHPLGAGGIDGRFASLGLALCLLLLAYIDLRSFRLPDVLTLPLLLAGLVWSSLQQAGSAAAGPIGSAIGALLGYGLIAGLGLVWRKALGREGIGLGDAKLLAAGGAWTGALGLPVILLVGSGAGLTIALGVALLRRSTLTTQVVPFGPFLSFGIWVAWCLPLDIFT